MTTGDIVQRIIHHRLDFEARNTKKEQKEIAVLKSIQKLKLNPDHQQNGEAKQNGEIKQNGTHKQNGECVEAT